MTNFPEGKRKRMINKNLIPLDLVSYPPGPPEIRTICPKIQAKHDKVLSDDAFIFDIEWSFVL